MAEGEIGWDGEINENGEEGGFELIPAGEYTFEVKSFERARFKGSDKLPACNQAKVKVMIDGKVTITHNLYLHEKTMGLLCDFFVGIGQRKHGQAVTMNWNKVPGSTGRCKVGIRKWKGKDGDEMESNEIRRFLDPEKQPATVAAPTTAPQTVDDLPF